MRYERYLAQYETEEEGRKVVRQHIAYERSAKNRAEALRIHGRRCLACGFSFDHVYGSEHARSYIQVHHVHSITTGVRAPDPAKDLVPLCSNCHSMAHRDRMRILGVEELKALIRSRRNDSE
jgi:5-methylcytosine-specific restriction protein A